MPIIVAKASMDELGMGGTNKNAYTGKVNNPYDTRNVFPAAAAEAVPVLVAAGGVAVCDWYGYRRQCAQTGCL